MRIFAKEGISLSGKMIGEGDRPLVCTPVIGKTRELILMELTTVLEKKPDLIEWRVDFFEGITDLNKVVSLAKQIVANTGDIPVIFTLRSNVEGGNNIPLSREDVFEIIATVCNDTNIAYVDYELSNPPEQIKSLRQITAETNTKIIASFHDFNLTPDKNFLLGKLLEAKEYGADVAKIAVMPNSLEDVLTLLGVTLEANKTVDIPIITVSMGTYGVASRLFGGVFGSAVTFAVGQDSSAPGQIPIEELRTVLNVVQKSMGI
jgi:3-dehydroquinate dehydratase-1